MVNDGSSIEVKWSDGHVSPYPAEWLLDRSFTEEAQKKRTKAYGQEHEFWGCEHKERLGNYNFSDVSYHMFY